MEHNMEEIYKKYADMVYAYLFSLTGSPSISEELTQETFYRAIKNISGFQNKCKISTWLCQIARHTWYQYLEKKKRRKEISFHELDMDLPSFQNIEEEFLHRQDMAELYRRIWSLNPDARQVILLRITENLSFQEIGDLLNRSETWARVTFYRGKQKLISGGNEHDEKRTL